MESLNLSKNDMFELTCILEAAEQLNGCDMYETEALSAWDCVKWDCIVSCECSNCRD